MMSIKSEHFVKCGILLNFHAGSYFNTANNVEPIKRYK